MTAAQDPTRPPTLAERFTYWPPSDAQRPRYKAINDAADTAEQALSVLLKGYLDGAQQRPIETDEEAFMKVCEATSAALLVLAETIEANAPASADRTAAIRCVALTRNAMNASFYTLKQATAMVREGTDPRALLSAFEGTSNAAITQLRFAVWQANTAIALEGFGSGAPPR